MQVYARKSDLMIQMIKRGWNIKNRIGHRLRMQRMYRGWTQNQLAQTCGLNRAYISQVESGKRNISIENIQKIAMALDVQLSELFHGM